MSDDVSRRLRIMGGHMERSAVILFAFYQGYVGGDHPLFIPILAGLAKRGHVLRIMVGPGVRPTRLPLSDDRLKGMGATLVRPNHIRGTTHRR
jgi:hypothetical protein